MFLTLGFLPAVLIEPDGMLQMGYFERKLWNPLQ
jgi:hypothetical protein